MLAIAARYGTRLIGRLIAVRDNELLVISFLGVAILIAGISEVLGVVDAIGAFIVGLILAGTPSWPRIRELVHPLRDAFAAIFFFAFGLAINPADITSVAGSIAIAATLTITMNVAAGLLTACLYGYGPQPAANIATTLLGRGEFALILAAMAATAGLDGRLAPFIASYVLVLAFLSPIVAGRSHLLAHALKPHTRCCQSTERQAPKRLLARCPQSCQSTAGIRLLRAGPTTSRCNTTAGLRRGQPPRLGMPGRSAVGRLHRAICLAPDARAGSTSAVMAGVSRNRQRCGLLTLQVSPRRRSR